MATKKTNNPTTITDENSLEIYSWCPKRVLFDALFGVVDGDTDEDRMREIIRLTNDFGTVYGKKVLKSFSFVKPGKEEPVDEEPVDEDQEDEEPVDDEAIKADKSRFTDDLHMTIHEPVARAANVEGPAPKPKKKAASKKASKK